LEDTDGIDGSHGAKVASAGFGSTIADKSKDRMCAQKNEYFRQRTKKHYIL
jgi:hypothetical protein